MLTLVTATSDRPLCFRLLERWIGRQSYQGHYRWIVADDGTKPVDCTMGQQHIRLKHQTDKLKSFRNNMLALLDAAPKGHPLVFVEDDDYYHPDWLHVCSGLLGQGYHLVGETRSKYYRVDNRRWHQFNANGRACLSQTAISYDVVPWLIERLRTRNPWFLDDHIWKRSGVPKDRRYLFPETRYVIGIKGLPGKRGIGMGHKLDTKHRHDPTGELLRKWIGEDADLYFRIASGAPLENAG